MTVLVSVLEPRSRLIPANLQEIPTDLEQTNGEEIPPDFMTPLMYAAKDGYVDYARKLLENGADPNENGAEQGLTALMFAAKGGHIEIVKLLLKAGADPNAVFTGHHVGFFTPLIMAITSDTKNRLEVIDTLIAGGAHLNPPPPFYGTPLDIAIIKNDIEMISALLQRGSDVNWEDGSGRTALATAVTLGGPNVDVVRLLLNAGADPNKPRISTGNHCVSILKFLDDQMSRDKVTKEVRRLIVQAGGRKYAKKSHSDQCKV